VINTFSQNRQEKKRQLFLEIGIAVGAIILLAVILPLMLSPFRLQLLGRFLALTIVALGIDLIWGYTGLLSLGHGIFFALGGYGIAMHLKLQLPAGQLPEFFTLYGVSELPWFWKPFYSFPFTFVAIFIIPAIVAGILGYLDTEISFLRTLEKVDNYTIQDGILSLNKAKMSPLLRFKIAD